MRLIWLPFCCILAGLNNAQADTYQNRNEGFNPLNVMQGMPNPMNVFDSSDRQSDYRSRRPPPPRYAPPAYHYPYPPGYGVPPRPQMPAFPRYPTQPNSAQIGSRKIEQMSSGSQQEATGESQSMTSATPAPGVRSMTPPAPGESQPAYQFRPMTPTEPAATATTSAVQDRSTSAQPQPAPPQQESTSVYVPSTPQAEQETPLFNGQPAIFRPMHLGVETTPVQ